jgi:phosphatidylserine/phosphatidylglycerophosphate/cardiolipin synthase-like enzyme/uncharacterized membrane protein YdjX (TVP38/TMEM64 family)
MKVSTVAWSSRAVSLFEPDRNCMAVVEAHRAAPLVDAESYFRAFRHACERARHSIIILAWDFDSRTRLDFEGGTGDKQAPPALLGEFLNYLARRRRHLHIYVLNWDYPMVFSGGRELRPIYGLGWTPHRRVHIRYDNTHPTGGSQHQKIVAVDDAMAFCGGLDLTARRWDCVAHKAEDERRVWEGEPYPPFHDVMAAVDGEAAATLAEIARGRWLKATGRRIPPAPRDQGAGTDPWPEDLTPHMNDVLVAVSRTLPQTEPSGEIREVEALYVDMIAAAKDCIYLENQYFTSDRLGEALASRLAEEDPPEIVVVTRLLSHGWLEEHTMEMLRTRLVNRLREADRKSRFEIYAPHVAGLKEGTCVDIHSKVAVVDQQWLRIGSANFANRSMGLDSECDLTFEAGGNRAHQIAIVDFRDGLISEHLGVPVDKWRATLKELGSLHGAIRALRADERTLRPLDHLPELSEPAMTVVSAADPERPVSLEQLIDQFSSTSAAPARRAGPAWAKIVSFALVLGALALMWRFTPLAEYVTVERVHGWAEAAGGTGWAPLALIVSYTPSAFVMFPRPLITIFAVVAFGPWLGFASAMAGVAISGVCIYYLGRTLSRDTVRRIAGERLNRTSELLRRHGLAAAFACSVAPVAPFIAVGVIAGAVRIKLWRYLGGMLLGMLPGTLATTVFADQIAAALGESGSINYWLVAGVVLVFVILLYVVRRWMKKLEQDERRGAGGQQRAPPGSPQAA